MKNNALQYTFRVWITSILVSPFLFGLLLLIRQVVTVTELINDGFRLIGMYLFLVALQLLFSFVTWLVFLLAVNIVCLIPISKTLTRVVLFCVGILLTVSTFMLLDDFIGLMGDRNSLVNLMYANCAGIGWGVWYYRLNAKATEQNDNEEQSISNIENIS